MNKQRLSYIDASALAGPLMSVVSCIGGRGAELTPPMAAIARCVRYISMGSFIDDDVDDE